MEKEKRRREALGEGRVDAETVITELLESVDLDKVVQEADDAESEYSTFWGDLWYPFPILFWLGNNPFMAKF